MISFGFSADVICWPSGLLVGCSSTFCDFFQFQQMLSKIIPVSCVKFLLKVSFWFSLEASCDTIPANDGFVCVCLPSRGSWLVMLLIAVRPIKSWEIRYYETHTGVIPLVLSLLMLSASLFFSWSFEYPSWLRLKSRQLWL